MNLAALLGIACALVPLCCACRDAQREPLGDGLGSSGAPEPAPAPDAAPLIVFLGDSLTAGNGLSAGEAFPARIEAELRRAGRPVRVVNAGVSGDTSAGGLARLDWLLRQDPDVLVLALGANDGLRGLSVEALERNLTAICERARAAGVRVLLAGMLVPPNYGEDYARSFAAVFPRVAAACEVPLVPFLLEGVGGVTAMNQGDGVHPNAAGQERIAATVLEALRPLLPEE